MTEFISTITLTVAALASLLGIYAPKFHDTTAQRLAMSGIVITAVVLIARHPSEMFSDKSFALFACSVALYASATALKIWRVKGV